MKMGETAYLKGSTNAIDVHLNGISTPNGLLHPNAGAANGVMAPYLNRSSMANGTVNPNSGSTTSIVTVNGTTNASLPSRGLPNSQGVNGFIASNSTENGTFQMANGSNSSLHSMNGCNGAMNTHSSCDAPILSGVNSVVGNGTLLAPAVKGLLTTTSANGSNGVAADNRFFGNGRRRSLWYEEEVNEDLRWCFSLCSILHTGVSKFQDIALLDTRPFGKVLILDGKLQSSEADEFVYHECLVHPAMLYHSSPKNIFIMGGGEGSTARETLRYRSVQKVVMCDIDKEVVAFCSAYLTPNKEAFRSNKLELVINDARAELENREDRFDVIIGDLADPMEGGPCYQLYSKGFYENVVKKRLNPGGIIVTQAGPAGVWSHTEVFSSIYNTLRHVFKYVAAYTAHIPSYADTWGWVMASDHPFCQSTAEDLDERIRHRIKTELRYIDGPTICSSMVLNKLVRRTLSRETHVYTEDSARFVYGRGTGLH
eukprot:c20334_g1_i1 orf=515-1966(+)